MNKLFKMLQESFGNPPSRNGLDLSRRDIFSTKVGIKVPFLSLETVPQDYHELFPVNVIRTMPFNEANFVRMKQHLDFYYVPFSAFMTNFHEYVQQTKDPVNSLLVGQNVETTFPTYRLDCLVVSIAFAHWVKFHGNSGNVTYNDFANSVEHETSVQDLTNIYSECGELVNIFVRPIPEDAGLMPVYDMFVNPIYQDAIRLLDMLGYGNYLQLTKVDITDLTSNEYKDWCTYVAELANSLFRKSVNIFRFAAYQCIYQNFGINTVYDHLNVYSFNFDDIVRNGALNSDMIGAWLSRKDNADPEDKWHNVNCVFSIRYSQWKKDIFTAAYPDSQFGGVSVVSVNYSVGSSSIGSSSPNAVRLMGVGTGSDSLVPAGSLVGVTRSAASNTYPVTSSFSILDLRRAEALQGWREDMMRSGFRAKQRQRSQFGVSPSYDPHCMPYVLGSVSSDVKKDVVTGTAGTEFAELAATGISTLGEDDAIKFDGSGRHDYGIIMGILTILPEADYDSFGLDLHNMKVDPFDFFTPAFQNIGLQSIPREYLDVQFGNGFPGSPNPMPSILGFVPRYAEYKQAYDKVHGEFCAFRLVPNDVAGGYPAVGGQFRSYVSTRYDMEKFGLSTLASLYVNPAIVDDIFKVSAEGDNSQGSDQFVVNCYVKIDSVRPMSILGLPRW